MAWQKRARTDGFLPPGANFILTLDSVVPRTERASLGQHRRAGTPRKASCFHSCRGTAVFSAHPSVSPLVRQPCGPQGNLTERGIQRTAPGACVRLLRVGAPRHVARCAHLAGVPGAGPWV